MRSESEHVVIRAVRMRATWMHKTRTNGVLDHDIVGPEPVSLGGDTLGAAVEALERRKQSNDYDSTLEHHRNGEVWVHWEQRADAGSDRYQLMTDQGVRRGGCRSHEPDQCWWLGNPFPLGQDALHVVVGSLSRLARHRHCDWAATTGEMRSTLFISTTPGSVGEDRCCHEPFALTYTEQAQVTAVAAQIAAVTGLTDMRVRNFDLLVGWRLFGVYDGETRWPGFTPASQLDPSVLDCWMTQLALQEMV